MAKSVKALLKERARAQEKKANARFYNMNSILGNDWAMFYVIIGGRMTGKSYALTDFLCRQKKYHGDMCKNYWMRISESSTKAMLANKADKLIDPDLKRKYDVDLTTKDCEVFDHGKPFMTVLPLSKFGKLKGVGFFDKDFKGFYNIVLDEFQLEIGEKRTSFDILYNFIGMIENIARTTKSKIRIFLVGNTLEEASTVLKAFNFLPQKFGRFYLKNKRCVIDNLEPTEEYLKDREGSAADILGGRSMSNYTNALTKDRKLLTDRRRKKPTAIIKFSKDPGSWYSVWDGDIICRYKNEKVAPHAVISMRPYLNEFYSMELRKMVIERYDACGWLFKDLISQSYFQGELEKVRKGV
jgi:hypothetical protein